MESLPLILTLKIDENSFAYFNGLRREYFPPERNFLDAHVTLFHHLPGENLSEICDDLTAAAEIESFPLTFTGWRFLGKGSAINIESAELLQLRSRLADFWREHLTEQDKQKFQPHITVQNKTEPDAAKLLYRQLAADWQPKNGAAIGLSLWHYLGAKWKLERDFPFRKIK